MTLLARFVGWACLVAAVVIAALTPALAAAKATSPDEQAAASSSLEFNEKDGTLNIEWSGPILPGMADYLRAALDTYAAASHRVVLFLDSAGGQVEEGDRVIHVLDEIKQTHRLITAVLNDKLCASMCIPVFLQGDDRLAARTSRWIFHEAARQGANDRERMEETLRLLQKYYVPVGVSAPWLKRIVPIIKRGDLWESGDDLISEKTGIVTYPLENWTGRIVAPSGQSAKLEGADRGP
jgi:ATP-dependent protease ClpP protease subunit